MDKKHLLELTLAVYKVTAIFPAKESAANLGFQIRESAGRILADFLLNQFESCSQDIGEILRLFGTAEEKNWVDSRNFSVLKREYDKIRQSIAPGEGSGKIVDKFNNHRQDKIIEAINENGKVRIGELVDLFPGLNRRTVLRDLDKLCQTGVAVRNGNGRGAYYVKNGLKHDISQ